MPVAENLKVWHTNLCDAIYRDQKFNQRKKFLFCTRLLVCLVLALCNLIYLTRTVCIKCRYAMCKSNYKTCLGQKRKLVHAHTQKHRLLQRTNLKVIEEQTHEGRNKVRTREKERE